MGVPADALVPSSANAAWMSSDCWGATVITYLRLLVLLQLFSEGLPGGMPDRQDMHLITADGEQDPIDSRPLADEEDLHSLAVEFRVRVYRAALWILLES